MNEFSDTEIWIATAFAFAVGYVLVSFLARLMKTEPPASQPTFADAARANAETSQGFASEEDKYAQILGVRLPATPDAIEQAYHDSLEKYHPDKVAYLDETFRELAKKHTAEIEAAVAFFRARSTSQDR